MSEASWEAPYFEDLRPGQVFEHAPGITLTSGHAALHQALTGGRCPLALDQTLAERVTGAPIADPALVWDCAIGQSTVVTGRVIANLFYRGLALHHAPAIGDTLCSTTEVLGLKQNRSATGLAVLRVTTRDQLGRIVLRFLRCAMLPLRRGDSQTGHSDDISAVDIGVAEPALTATISGWKHGELDAGVRGLTIREGETREIKDFEVVHGSPGLARLTLNLATAHVRVDSAAPRLVYGGQAIAIAAGQLARLFPQCIYILAWMSCDHTAPVREGDGLRSRVTVERVRRLPCGWVVVELHCLVCAGGDRPDEPVLDWRPVALFA